MNYSHLRAFHAVASQGSFTKAATALHVTQPTISDQVKALEQRYNVILFERRGHHITLTSVAQALLEITQRQFSLEAEAEQLLTAAKGLAQGLLRVSADAPYHVVPLLGRFNRLHPGIRLTLDFGNSTKVLDALFERHTDIAVLPNIGHDHRLFSTLIRRDKLVAFVPKGHEWAGKRSLPLVALAEQRLVLREHGSTTRAVFEHALQQSGITMGPVMEIGSREGVREAVAAGLGIGIVGATEFGNDRRLHAINLQGNGLEVTEYAACLDERRMIRTINAFFELFTEK